MADFAGARFRTCAPVPTPCIPTESPILCRTAVNSISSVLRQGPSLIERSVRECTFLGFPCGAQWSYLFPSGWLLAFTFSRRGIIPRGLSIRIHTMHRPYVYACCISAFYQVRRFAQLILVYVARLSTKPAWRISTYASCITTLSSQAQSFLPTIQCVTPPLLPRTSIVCSEFYRHASLLLASIFRLAFALIREAQRR